MEIHEATAKEILSKIPMRRDINDRRTCVQIVIDWGLSGPESTEISYNERNEQTDNPDGSSSEQ